MEPKQLHSYTCGKQFQCQILADKQGSKLSFREQLIITAIMIFSPICHFLNRQTFEKGLKLVERFQPKKKNEKKTNFFLRIMLEWQWVKKSKESLHTSEKTNNVTYVRQTCICTYYGYGHEFFFFQRIGTQCRVG